MPVSDCTLSRRALKRGKPRPPTRAKAGLTGRLPATVVAHNPAQSVAMHGIVLPAQGTDGLPSWFCIDRFHASRLVLTGIGLEDPSTRVLSPVLLEEEKDKVEGKPRHLLLTGGGDQPSTKTGASERITVDANGVHQQRENV